MNSTPLVSVIIPCYNHGRYIETALESVKAQTYSNIDIVIIDDGSTDAHTVEVLKKLAQNYTVIFQPNQGPSVARNNAVKQTKGEYLFCLDSDNKMRKDYILKGVQLMEADAAIGAVYGDFETFGDSNELKLQEDFDIKKQLRYNQIDMCAVIRRKAYDSTGGLDEYMSKRGLEDWDFWINMYENNWKVVHLPEVMFDYFVTNSSRTVQVANNNLRDLKRYVWQKHAVLLAQQYEELYHLNKNLPKSTEYKLGSVIMSPLKWVKSLVKRTPGK